LEKEEKKVGKAVLYVTLKEKPLPREAIGIQHTKESSVNRIKFIRWIPWVLVVVIFSFAELRRFFIQWFLTRLSGFDVHFKFFDFVTGGYHSRQDAGSGEKGL